jgi:hypothetical protein
MIVDFWVLTTPLYLTGVRSNAGCMPAYLYQSKLGALLPDAVVRLLERLT